MEFATGDFRITPMPRQLPVFARIALALLAWSVLAAGAPGQTATPISLTGFNHDLIIGASEGAPTTTTSVATWKYYESGLAGTSQGLPVSRTFLSAANNDIQFQFGSYYGTNNTLIVSSGGSGSLTLATAASFQDIHFLASVQGTGGGSMTITLNFSDNSNTVIPAYTGIPDWTTAPSSIALQDMGLSGNSIYSGSLYMALFDHTLSVTDQAKTLESLDIAFSGANTLMFFGASGTSAIPEPSAYAVIAGALALGLAAWRRKRIMTGR